MADIQELEQRKAALEKILSNGAGMVRHGDKSVQYRSSAEIERELTRLDRQIAKAKGRRRRRVTYIEAGRGY